MSILSQVQASLAICELAEAVLRLYNSKSLHNYAILEALATHDAELFGKLLAQERGEMPAVQPPPATLVITARKEGHYKPLAVVRVDSAIEPYTTVLEGVILKDGSELRVSISRE